MVNDRIRSFLVHYEQVIMTVPPVNKGTAAESIPDAIRGISVLER